MGEARVWCLHSCSSCNRHPSNHATVVVPASPNAGQAPCLPGVAGFMLTLPLTVCCLTLQGGGG